MLFCVVVSALIHTGSQEGKPAQHPGDMHSTHMYFTEVIVAFYRVEFNQIVSGNDEYCGDLLLAVPVHETFGKQTLG